jgi:RNA polymerase sigma-70 factor (ECF subfamily)
MEQPILRNIPEARSVAPRELRAVGGGGVGDRVVEGRRIPPTIDALFQESYASIVRALVLAGGDLAAAEDATQEAFVQAHVLWKRISRYDNPGAWVRRVAINKLHNAHRSRARGEAAVRRLSTDEASAPWPSETESDLVAALRRLPYKQRICAVLYFVEGLSIAEVAQTMEITAGSVSQHLNRARTALRAHLEVTA